MYVCMYVCNVYIYICTYDTCMKVVTYLDTHTYLYMQASTMANVDLKNICYTRHMGPGYWQVLRPPQSSLLGSCRDLLLLTTRLA